MGSVIGERISASQGTQRMYEELKPAVARLERLSQLLEGLIEYVSCHV